MVVSSHQLAAKLGALAPSLGVRSEEKVREGFLEKMTPTWTCRITRHESDGGGLGESATGEGSAALRAELRVWKKFCGARTSVN